MFVPPRLSQQPHTVSLEEDVWWWFNAGNNKKYLGLQVKCPTFFVRFKPNFEFLDRSPLSYWTLISIVEAALIYVDRRTDSLTPFQSKRALLWLFNVSQNNNTYLGLHVKFPTFVPHFNYPWIFSTDFRRTLISNFTKIRPVEAALIQSVTKKTGTFEKPNKNWRNPRKEIYWQKLNHYNAIYRT